MIKSHQIHEFGPVYQEDSHILILGSFPSVKSREMNFYYGHPKNRFWKLMSLLYQEEEPISIPEKKRFLAKHRIALWDVIESCDIAGSSDSSIQNVTVNDIGKILKEAGILAVYANGQKAESLYNQYIRPKTGLEIIRLPSTSPANAAFTMERLLLAWKRILT